MTRLDLPRPHRDWALFLDFDGTLVEIADSPDAVRAERHLVAMLESVSRLLHGAVAVVSGRPVAELDQHLGPGLFAAAGLHGLEIRPRAAGPVTRLADAPIEAAVVAALEDFARGNPGVRVEHKGPAAALHFRGRPELAAASGAVAAAAAALAPGLHVLAGKMVFEIKPGSVDKGEAVRRFMREPPFAGRVPVFVGDDVTDEDGFGAAAGLGGFGVKVGAGDTAAAYRIGGVADLLDWIAAIPDRLGRAGEGVAGR